MRKAADDAPPSKIPDPSAYVQCPSNMQTSQIFSLTFSNLIETGD
jgi:hypothetical protein